MKQFLTSLVLLFSLGSANVAAADGSVGNGVGSIDEAVDSQQSEQSEASGYSWLLSAALALASDAITDVVPDGLDIDKGLDKLDLDALNLDALNLDALNLGNLLEATKKLDVAAVVDSTVSATERLFERNSNVGSGTQSAQTDQHTDDTTGVDDPFESYNRMLFRFNQRLDEVALKPIAEHYREYTPELVRIGFRNFFNNIGDVGVLTNSALQGKFEQALSDSTRVAINTVAGVGGVIDVASMIDIEKNNEDFGQTFGVWGIPEGPYIVLPLLGPRTLRSAVGTIADTALQVETLGAFSEAASAPDLVTELMALNLVDRRSRMLGQTELMEELAIDPYLFSRQAYLAYRRCQVEDCDKIDYRPAAPEEPGNNLLDELDELDELDSLK